jgi:hypothetical protein
MGKTTSRLYSRIRKRVNIIKLNLIFYFRAVGFFTRSDIGPARNIGTNE